MLNFNINDVVTRTGTDEHLVLQINEGNDLIKVKCIKKDAYGIYEIGEEEWNIPSRYKFLYKMVNNN